MITQPVWRKSTYSGQNDNCVEVANRPTTRMVRDSKLSQSPVLEITESRWEAFVDHIKQA
ncbi:DUF397 domain-containing protein [Streptomyces sp. NPDC002138]|uniref:DUF397 domain-containing protein n=1 Tax=Streptomyces sp. NPDC002138 TaxID=3154410 RepID=UPI003320A44C